MFESAGASDASAGSAREDALARLAAVLPSRPLRVAEGPVRRAVEVAPGVFRSAGRRPLWPAAAALPRVDARDASAIPAGEPGTDPVSAVPPTTVLSGSALATALSAMQPDGLPSFDLLEAIAGWERLVAWAQARQAEVISEFARRRPGPYAPDQRGRSVSEFAADEIAARLSVSRQTAENKLHLAVALVDLLPATRDALLAGHVDLPKARAIAEHTASLPDLAACRAVEARVLARAGCQTLPQLRRSLARAVTAADPQAAAKRHTSAKAGRCVRLQPLPDGMAEINAVLPAEDAMVVLTTVDAFAQAADPADPRGLDARRADALVDLCRGVLTFDNVPGPSDDRRGGPGGSRATRRMRRAAGQRGRGPQIQVTVAASTLLGVDEAPAELAGYGPIPAEVARAIAADPDGTWRRLLTDPASGTLLDYGTRVYRPPRSLARHVRARDQVCQFPGCRQPAWRCDLDHRRRFPDGHTSDENLGPLCRHHHRAKTEGGWIWIRHDDGTITWIAPTGHSYPADTPAVLDVEPTNIAATPNDDDCPF